MATPRISLPLDQDWLIERMQSLGYPANKEGVCFGVAYMAMLAVLNGETDKLDQHFFDIYNIPADRFKTTLEKLLHDYVKLMADTKKELWNALFPGVQEFNFNNLTALQKTQFETEWQEKLIELRLQRPELLEIYNFFDGIEVAQNIKDYPHLFSQNHMPKNQTAELIARRIYPENLKHQVNNVASISGIFSSKELTEYFNDLMFTCEQTSLAADPIVIMIYGRNQGFGPYHQICIGYDPFQGWCLIDASELPAYKIACENTEELAKKVVAIFSQNENAILSNRIFTVKPNPADDELLARDENIESSQQDERLRMISNMAEKIKLYDSNNNSWFCKAVEENDRNLVKLLLKAGADVNQENNSGFTPLLTAIKLGYTDMVKLLLENNANCRYENQKGDTPLLLAAKKGRIEIIEELANYLDLDEANKNGLTAFHAAASKGQCDVIKLLIDAGEDLNSETNKGYTPLIIAAQHDQLETVKQLLDQLSDINHIAVDGSTALFLAAREGHLDVVKLLLEQGADPALSVSWDEEYVEEFADLRNVTDAMSELLGNKYGDVDDDTAVTIFEISPLEIAEIMGHNQIAECLKKALQLIKDANLSKSENFLFFSQPKNQREFAQAEKNDSVFNEEMFSRKTG